MAVLMLVCRWIRVLILRRCATGSERRLHDVDTLRYGTIHICYLRVDLRRRCNGCGARPSTGKHAVVLRSERAIYVLPTVRLPHPRSNIAVRAITRGPA